MKKKVSIALIFVLMLSCLTACGGGGASTASGENSAAAEETKQVEKTSAKSGSGDRVFERDLTRTIPEGYEELDWFDEKDKVPVKVMVEYSLIENPKTEMVGLATYDGDIVIEAEYSDLEFMYRDGEKVFFYATYEDERGVLDEIGKEVIPFDAAYGQYEGNRFVRVEEKDGSKSCVTYEITTGEELGRFDMTWAYFTLDSNGWIKMDSEDERGISEFACIVDSNGNQISDQYISKINLIGAYKDWTYGQIDEEGVEEAVLENWYIFDETGQIVAGPYDFVEPAGNGFLCGNSGEQTGTWIMSIYDPAENKEYPVDDFLKYYDAFYYAYDNALVTYAQNQEESDRSGVSVRNLETGEDTVISESGHVSESFSEKERLIYNSNDTYKLADLEGNLIGDDRYYDMYEAEYYDFQTFSGVFLKQENGDWVYVDGDGNLSKEDGLFHGNEDAPTTYNELPIIGFWEYEGTPCVVVEEEDKQVGYAL